VPVADAIEAEYGIPIVNKRIAVTPIAQLAAACSACDVTPLAVALERAATEVGIDFIGGFSALVHKGMGDGDPPSNRLDPPRARDHRARVFVRERGVDPRGMNMDAILRMAHVVRETAEATAERDSIRLREARGLREHGRGQPVHGGRRARYG